MKTFFETSKETKKSDLEHGNGISETNSCSVNEKNGTSPGRSDPDESSEDAETETHDNKVYLIIMFLMLLRSYS